MRIYTQYLNIFQLEVSQSLSVFFLMETDVMGSSLCRLGPYHLDLAGINMLKDYARFLYK